MAQQANPHLRTSARLYLEYGENREGYWTCERLLMQLTEAAMIAEAKYPKEEGYRLYWVFDHSSCHAAMADDALNANKMNAKPGGKQPQMHDTVWNGKVQRMVFADGTPKGLKQVLSE